MLKRKFFRYAQLAPPSHPHKKQQLLLQLGKKSTCAFVSGRPCLERMAVNGLPSPGKRAVSRGWFNLSETDEYELQ